MTVRSKILTAPFNKAYRSFGQDLTESPWKTGGIGQLLKYPLTNTLGAPQSVTGNTSCTSYEHKGTTPRYNQSRK
ncbi:protein of unknown function [Pseudomonas sp. JV241A]|nr:protein of unknown function [Pseudomonas sp. JV241A]